MKTESNGGSSAENNMRRRLARLYESELDRAERDFPTMRTPLWDGPDRLPRRRTRLRFVAGAVGFVSVAAILVGGGWLVANPQSGPTGPGAIALGADGIPNQIDGEHVYRVGETVESGKLGGYLLGGYVFQEICPVGAQPLDTCFGLGPTAGSDAATGGIDVGEAHDASDPNQFSLGSWLGAPIVARMKGCTWDNGTPCPPVVMSIVWPTVPTEIAGEHVYRATDQAAFSKLTPSFLLGGVFIKPAFFPPCPMPLDRTSAEQQLLPYCNIQTIDGLKLSPLGNVEELGREVLVVRAHVNDPLGAQCPAAAQADCKAAIVVESVVWRSDEVITGARPSIGHGGPSAVPSATGSSNRIEPSAGTGTGQALSSPDPRASLILPPPPPSPILPNAS
jgi:hypothetical protein